MKATELRIGDYVYSITCSGQKQVDKITSINEKGGIESGFAWNTQEPISLTEQWLKDFGFKKAAKHGGNGFKLGNMIVFKVHNSATLKDWFYEIEYHYNNFDDRITIVDRYDYVHQLQNLYFALTGNELIKK